MRSVSTGQTQVGPGGEGTTTGKEDGGQGGWQAGAERNGAAATARWWVGGGAQGRMVGKRVGEGVGLAESGADIPGGTRQFGETWGGRAGAWTAQLPPRASRRTGGHGRMHFIKRGTSWRAAARSKSTRQESDGWWDIQLGASAAQVSFVGWGGRVRPATTAWAVVQRAQRGRPMRCRLMAWRKQAMTSVSSTCCAAKCSATASSSCSRVVAACSAAGRWYAAP